MAFTKPCLQKNTWRITLHVLSLYASTMRANFIRFCKFATKQMVININVYNEKWTRSSNCVSVSWPHSSDVSRDLKLAIELRNTATVESFGGRKWRRHTREKRIIIIISMIPMIKSNTQATLLSSPLLMNFRAFLSQFQTTRTFLKQIVS